MNRPMVLVAWVVLAVQAAPSGAVPPAGAAAPVEAAAAAREREMTASERTVARFAGLALDCVHRRYPNQVSLVLQSDADARPPHLLTPVFYGCYDWHSAVHAHWMLLRLARLYPDAEFTPRALDALGQSFTADNVKGELAYFAGAGRAGFERPYGLAWFLQLTAELREAAAAALPASGEAPAAVGEAPAAVGGAPAAVGEAPAAVGAASRPRSAPYQPWLTTLSPLEDVVEQRFLSWLPNLVYPVRSGTHNQSAFAFALALDWARVAGRSKLAGLIVAKSRQFYAGDRDCPLAYEPSGEDFLSPCLMEADLMRRVLPRDQYPGWLTGFLPGIPVNGSAAWLEPGEVVDPTDGRLVHLDGFNLSRAWNLEAIAAALPPDDPRRASLLAAAEVHRTAGLAAVTGEHYEGGHWLASFATYLVTGKALEASPPQ